MLNSRKIVALAMAFLIASLALPTGVIAQSTFSIGDSIKTTTNVNVRDQSGMSSAVVATKPANTRGTITDGPQPADNYIWWKIRFDDGTEGWSAENYLEKVDSGGTTQSTTTSSSPTINIISPGENAEYGESGSTVKLSFNVVQSGVDKTYSCKISAMNSDNDYVLIGEISCKTNEESLYWIPVSYARTGGIMIIKTEVFDSQSSVASTITIFSTGIVVGDNSVGSTRDPDVSIEEQGAETTGRLSLKATAKATKGVKSLEIFTQVKLPGQAEGSMTKKNTCSGGLKISIDCQFVDSNQYQEGTVIKYKAKVTDNSNAYYETDIQSVTITNSVPQDVGDTLQCTNACMQRSFSANSVPFGYCSDNGAVPPGISQNMNGLGLVRGPFQVGAAGCPTPQKCWCVYVDYQDGFSNFQNDCRHDSLTVGKAPQSYDDPAKMDNAPKKTVSPPPYACDAGTKSTVVAELSSSRVESGSVLTLTGTVGRITNKCNGYEYDCRQQRVLECSVDQGFFRTHIEYEDCPSGYTKIYAKGKKSYTNWGTILGIGSILCDLGTTIAAKSSTGEEKPSGSSTPSDSTDGSSVPLGGGAPPDATSTGNVVSGKAVNIAERIVMNKVVSDSDNKITGYNPLVIAMAICTAIKGARTVYCSAQPRALSACYSVCAKDAKTVVSPTYESVCRSSGTSYVVGATEKTYNCSASPRGTCGGFPNKEVNVKIRNSAGDVAQSSNLFSDSEGNFEYTIRAPFNEGRYNAIVTVPGGI